MTDTLKSICEQCTQLKNPQLDFIHADFGRHREILSRDLGELVSAAMAENEKSVVVLAGITLEGVLYTLIQCQSAYITERRGEEFVLRPDHSLQNYVEIYNRYLRVFVAGPSLPDSVVAHRNLVHISRELDYSANVCALASREMLRILDDLLAALSKFASPE